MIIERLKGFWRDDLELEHRQVIIRNAIEQIEDLREALALEQRTAGAEIERLRAENEKLKDVLKNCIAALRHAYFHGFTELYKTTAEEAAKALWENGDE